MGSTEDLSEVLEPGGTSSLLCFKATKTTSTGIWVGDRPFDCSAPLLLAQISLIFAATRITHAVLRHLGQPQVVSHVIAGILLGPSFLCRHEGFQALMFPPRSWVHLNLISFLAFILFIFVIGVKTDLGVIRKSGKKALFIAEASVIFPYFLVSYVSEFVSRSLPDEMPWTLTVVLSGRWALTSNAVLACLLTELKLLTTKLGRLAMSASLIVDFQSMLAKSVLGEILTTIFVSSYMFIWSAATFVGFMVLIFLVARPVVLWMIRRTPEGETMDEGYLVAVLLMAMVCGLVGEMIGQHVTVGPILLGLVLPGGPPLGTTLVERLDRLVSGVFLPVYVAVAGMRMDVRELVDARVCWSAVFLIGSSVAAKMGGVLGACLCFRMPFRDAIAVGLMMNCRGIVELYTYTAWQDFQLVDDQIYAVNVLSMIAVGWITTALLMFLYNPSMRFLAYKRRTIEQSRRTEVLRILACAHDERNASPLITLLESSRPNPICVYLLHLIPLEGRTNTVLAPYETHKKSYKFSTVTDHIVNAFRNLEQKNTGHFSLLPFIALSPYATMHDDIFSLAVDKKIALILLPFHKHAEIDGAVISANPSIRAMNINVLHCPPCSVAILIDHGFSAQLFHSIAVYFLGGADDREALAFAIRMADNPAVGLTVVRFVLPKELREGGDEESFDDEAVKELKALNDTKTRVNYREEEVSDGAETVEVIRGMSGEYSLLIVGRREGEKSRLTAGLEMWSEFPELGVIGDLLASSDFGSKVSTLVVQQQPKVVGGGKADGQREGGGAGDYLS